MNYGIVSRKNCRICEGTKLKKIIEWSQMPLAAEVIDNKDKEPDKYFLDVYICEDCGHVQLIDIIDQNLYENYLYTPSFSTEYSVYLEKFADDIVKRYGVGKVIEIGSSDGLLLQKLQEKGCMVMGFEPSSYLAERANTVYKTYTKNSYFSNSEQVKTEINKYFGESKVDIVVIRHVMEHLDELKSIMEAIREVLKPGGTFVMEVPYLKNMVEEKQFYAFFHEHLSYFSLKAVQNVMSKVGFCLSDAYLEKVEGGAIVIHATNKQMEYSEKVKQLLEDEERIISIDNIIRFACETREYIEQIKEFVHQCKKENKTIIGWGAGQRAVTLLNACNFTANDIEMVIDVNENYQGKYLPGTGIQVVGPEVLNQGKIDGVIVFATGYIDSIMASAEEYRKIGGKFIKIIPQIEWIE